MTQILFVGGAFPHYFDGKTDDGGGIVRMHVRWPFESLDDNAAKFEALKKLGWEPDARWVTEDNVIITRRAD